MIDTTDRFIFELLRDSHDRHGFDCGNAELNAYLRTRARQDMERGSGIAYVLVPDAARDTIAGFYTLSSTSVKLTDWPQGIQKKLPRYPLVPATLIGRLAASTAFRGHRVGERLLIDALARSLAASRTVGSAAVIVDAKSDDVAAFYMRYGFNRFPDQSNRLFIPMKTIARVPKR